MKNKDIYDAALRFLSEKNELGANEDYEERAPYIIAAFCSECAETDKIYRRVNGLEASKGANPVYVGLGDDFPCSSRFSSAASMYLASMLIFDYNNELSEKLFDRYSDMMSAICCELPAIVEPINDKYFF